MSPDEPKGDILPNTKIHLSDPEIVEKWTRMKEWVYDLPPGSGSNTAPDAAARSAAFGGEETFSSPEPVDMSLKEDFGEIPKESAALVHRAETIYNSLAPAMRKRVAKKIMVYVANKAGADGTVKTSDIKSGIGRFQSQIDELIEYFVRQGILKFTGPAVGISDPAIFNTWSDL